MAIHTISKIYNTPEGAIVNAASSVTDTNTDGYDGVIGGSATNVLINISFPFATLSSFGLLSDQDLTIYTNAVDGSGGNTLHVLAGVPFVWNTSIGFPNPFSVNVTKFYANNLSATPANLRIRSLFH